MIQEKLFASVKLLVKTSENYVPRNYETIGGYHGVQKDENTASILEEILSYLKEFK